MEMRLPIDTALLPKDATSPDLYRHLEDMTEEFRVVRDMAKQNIEAVQKQHKLYHDRKAVKPTHQLGDRVWLNNPNKTVGLNPKLQPKYLGPYYITDVGDNNTYELRNCSTHKPTPSRVNASRLKRYISTTVRDITHNDITEEESSHAEDKDSSTPKAGPSSADDGAAPESQSAPDDTPSTQTDRQHGQRTVETISRCQNYKGKKWYLIKWSDHKFKSWEIEDNVPEEAIINFHVTRTQKGKARKSKKKA